MQLEWGELVPSSPAEPVRTEQPDPVKERREELQAIVVDYLGEDDRAYAFNRREVLELMRRAVEQATAGKKRAPKPVMVKKVPPKKDDSPIVETFPCARDEVFELRKSLFDILQAAHPKVNGLQVVREAKVYIVTERLYTKGGMPSFLRTQFRFAQRNAERGPMRWNDRPAPPAARPPVMKSTMDPEAEREIRAAQQRRVEEEKNAKRGAQVLSIFEQARAQK